MNFLPPPPLPLARKVIRASRKLKRFGPWRPVLTSWRRVLAACCLWQGKGKGKGKGSLPSGSWTSKGEGEWSSPLKVN